MALAIRHRGPDAEGTGTDPGAGLAFGHCRLSIVELAAAGAQPMLSPSGRYVISYNGEIFNFQALRQILEQHGQSFKGHSDTEVLLAGIDTWGLEETLRRANGMFAFALWDRYERKLVLCRDRVGKKPLRSEEQHTSELQPLMRISYAVFCLKKKKQKHRTPNH